MCCGSRSMASRPVVSRSAPVSRTTAPPASTTFEYTGATGLTVVSPTTGKRYHFEKPGAQLAVDPQDRGMMLFVPNLRPVRFTSAS